MSNGSGKRLKRSSAPGPVSRLSDLIRELEAVPKDSFSSDKVASLAKRLATLAEKADPVHRPSVVFDPADPVLVGRFVAMMLAAQPQAPLGSVPKFYGSGVYAIYYKGGFAPYKPLSNSEHPVYVGKAKPENSKASKPMAQGNTLWSRINEHKKSIEKATSTLLLSDFTCRFLVVATGYESAAESYLIHLFQPIWNSEIRLCYGIGKHGDDAETRANDRSPWDTMHPGRHWAAKSKSDQKSQARIEQELVTHFLENKPFKNLNAILKHCLSEIPQFKK
jgi:hypothetical protein